MAEALTYKVRTSAKFGHDTDLVLTPHAVRLGDRELAAGDIAWVKMWGGQTKHKGFKAATFRGVELGSAETSLRAVLSDMFYGKKHTDQFPELALAVLQFYGPVVTRRMVDTVAAGGLVEVGPMRFTASKAEFPRMKFMFFKGEPVAVPWDRVKCYCGISLDGGVATNAADLWRVSLGNGEHGYAGNLALPNGCFVKPLVQYMQAHPELSAGLWFVARANQKLGPFFWPQLLQMAAAGLLNRSDMVSQEGSQRWSPGASVPGLFAG
jgi:hypothetical protein